MATYRLDLTVDPAWDHLSFQYQFDATPSPTTLSLTIAAGDQAVSVWSMDSTQTVNGEFLDSRRIVIAAFQGQLVTLQFALACAEAEAEAVIQNLTFWQSPRHSNRPPEADAGPDRVVAADPNGLTTIMLDGTSTRDADGDELAYWWLMDDQLVATGVQPTVTLPPGSYPLTLVVRDTADHEDHDETIVEVAFPFMRGDSNGDGVVDVSDPIRTLLALFTDRGRLDCVDAADADDDGEVNITDPIFTLKYLFTEVDARLPEPWLTPDLDPTADRLGCDNN